MKLVSRMCVAVIVFALLAAPAFAQKATDAEKRIKELEQKIEQLTAGSDGVAAAPVPQNTADLEKRIKELEQKLAALLKEKEAPVQKLMNGEEEERVMEPVALAGFYDNGYLVAQSKDGAFKYWLDGRVQIDLATFAGAKNHLATGAEIRRARIGLKATLFTNWLTEVDVDFADNAIEMKDMWLGYGGFKNSVIRVGNHKAPFGLDTLTSSKYIAFIERAYVDAWSPDRLLGVSYSRWGKMWQFSGGFFGEPGGTFNNKDTLTGGGVGENQGWSLVGRASVAPLNTKTASIHIGVAAANRHPFAGKLPTSGSTLPDREDAARLIKFDSRAGTHVSRAKFLSTGDMKFTKSFNLYSGELAGTVGPVMFQGEYQKSDVNRYTTSVATVVDHSFKGYYGQILWLVTGEHHPYSASEGEFGRVMPKRKAGAFELGLRYNVFDLNDITTVDPIAGGKAKNLTLGANWYLNANHKVMVNLTWVNNDQYAKPGSDWAPLPSGMSTTMTPVYGDDFRIFEIRYQVSF